MKDMSFEEIEAECKRTGKAPIEVVAERSGLDRIDTAGTTKARLIERARAHPDRFEGVGYKTVENFVAEIEAMDDQLFFEWYDLKPGDKFLGKPGNSWGHTDDFKELEFVSRFDWLFPGAGIGANYKCNYMMWTFLHQFGGRVK